MFVHTEKERVTYATEIILCGSFETVKRKTPPITTIITYELKEEKANNTQKDERTVWKSFKNKHPSFNRALSCRPKEQSIKYKTLENGNYRSWINIVILRLILVIWIWHCPSFGVRHSPNHNNIVNLVLIFMSNILKTIDWNIPLFQFSTVEMSGRNNLCKYHIKNRTSFTLSPEDLCQQLY